MYSVVAKADPPMTPLKPSPAPLKSPHASSSLSSSGTSSWYCIFVCLDCTNVMHTVLGLVSRGDVGVSMLLKSLLRPLLGGGLWKGEGDATAGDARGLYTTDFLDIGVEAEEDICVWGRARSEATNRRWLVMEEGSIMLLMSLRSSRLSPWSTPRSLGRS